MVVFSSHLALLSTSVSLALTSLTSSVDAAAIYAPQSRRDAMFSHSQRNSPALESRAAPGNKTVIIQMFEWNWDSISAECTNFIGPAGYGYVQVSPPQEHVLGAQWYTDYQPVSYILTSKRGNRAQFSSMINTCHAAGVKVLSDTLWNHMTGMDSGTGTAGSSYTHYNYPGIYTTDNFHHCGLTSNDDISNYDSRAQVQTCELVNLADLATETQYVQNRLAQYGQDLISLGIDGFRLDAAKHMAASDIAGILSKVNPPTGFYVSQEVIWGSGEPIQPFEYINNGDVQEFRYTTAVQNAFSGGGISSLQNLDNQGWVTGCSANVFVANHDTERNGASLNFNSPSNTYVNAMVFSLAHPYGTPTILSSYTYSNSDDGAPNAGAGTCSGTGGSNGWICQHRFPAVAGMVGFHNIVGTLPITNWVSPQSQQIAFGRGYSAFVAINNVDSTWTATFSTSLPAGSYCDVITGKSVSGACSGTVFVVSSSGSFSATVPARGAIAIHIGALSTKASTTSTSMTSTSTTATSTSRTSTSSSSATTSTSRTSTSSSSATTSTSRTTSATSSSTTATTSTRTTTASVPSGSVAVTFQENAQTVVGENIYLVGSISQLMTWDPNSAILLSSAAYPVWSVTVNIPAGTSFQYKFLRKQNGNVNWESDPNRQATANSASMPTQTLSSTFR